MNVGIDGGKLTCMNESGMLCIIDGPVQIENCYSTASIVGTDGNTWTMGGIAGGSSTNYVIENCYFDDTVYGESTSTCATIVRDNDGSNASKVKNCFYNIALNSRCVKRIGTGLTTAQFANKTNFTGWDFENTWIMKNGRPELRIFLSADEIASLEAGSNT